MYTNNLWYEKQDEATKKRLNEIFHQKKIYKEAIEKRAGKDKAQVDENANNGAPVRRKLFE